MEQTFTVQGEFVDERLDKFLVAQLDMVRNQVQHLIRDRFVTVNGKTASVHQWLHAGDVVIVSERPKLAIPVPALDIVDETDNWLVLNKPVGVLVHPALNSPFPRLTDALLEKYPAIISVGEVDRPGIVHRLDRDVSGLLVVAKTIAMYDWLKSQFKDKQVTKRYTGLVEGILEDDVGVVNFPISRSKTFKGRMAAHPTGDEGKSAETRFTVLERFPHLTLVELQPITGRMHQLRVHMKALGHPLVGDTLYGRRLQGKPVEQPLSRIFLQATHLEFNDLDGERRVFSLPLNFELATYLNTLRHVG